VSEVAASEIALEDLVVLWRGRTSELDIGVERLDRDASWQTLHYKGILDGPFLGEGPGVEFLLGSGTILGDIAVGGPLISFEPARSDGSSALVLGETYAELHVTDLPIIASVAADAASWESRLTDGRAVRCRLSAPLPT